jgi:hypothetical protein
MGGLTRGWRRFGKISLSDCKGHFEDAGMPHKMDELLTAAGLPTDIDVIPNSTGDSENADFTSILDNVSTVYLDLIY